MIRCSGVSRLIGDWRNALTASIKHAIFPRSTANSERKYLKSTASGVSHGCQGVHGSGGSWIVIDPDNLNEKELVVTSNFKLQMKLRVVRRTFAALPTSG
jgi:hypothetical protein